VPPLRGKGGPARPSSLGNQPGEDPPDGSVVVPGLPRRGPSLLRPLSNRSLLGLTPPPHGRAGHFYLAGTDPGARVPPGRLRADLVHGMDRRGAGPQRAGSPLSGRLPRRHQRPRLHRPGAGGTAPGGPGHRARPASLRGLLREGVSPSVRAEVRPDRIRCPHRHHGDQTVRGRRVGCRGGTAFHSRGRVRAQAEGCGGRGGPLGAHGGGHAGTPGGHRYSVRRGGGARRCDEVRHPRVPVSRRGAAIRLADGLCPRGHLPGGAEVRAGPITREPGGRGIRGHPPGDWSW
jgi:hypothetical protein